MAFLLEAPFEARALVRSAGAEWSKARGCWVYKGNTLPATLRPFLPKQYSWADFQMHPERGSMRPATGTGEVTLRKDQADDVHSLLEAFDSGAPEVLIASKTGVGKTYTGLNLAMSLPRSGRVLIVCPKSAIPGWRAAIQAFGEQGKQFCIINYESLKKLLKPVQVAAPKRKTKRGRSNARTKQARATAEKGVPYYQWDVLILDEAHYLSNPRSQRTMAKESILRECPNARAIYISATIGKDPSRLSMLARGLAWRTGRPEPKKSITIEEWYEWCKAKGMQVDLQYWGKEPSLKWEYNERDLRLVNHLLFNGTPTWAVRTDPGWDAVNRYTVPIELTPEEVAEYNESWNEYNTAMKGIEKDFKNGKISKQKVNNNTLAAQMRYRQKAGRIKVPHVTDYIKDTLDGADVQVAVSAEFTGTVDTIIDRLTASGIKAVRFTGQNTDTREEERKKFQRGEAQVIVFTPSESFNLHQGEMPGTDTPRIQICGEPSADPIKAVQKEGRTNRNAMNAPVLYPSAIGTIDEKMYPRLMKQYEAIERMMGDDVTTWNHVDSLSGDDMKGILI